MEPQATKLKSHNNQSVLAYEHVLSRNFEIIESFLSKFHQIYDKHDQFDRMFEIIQNRVIELQVNKSKIQKIEEKLASNSSMIEKKISSLKEFLISQISLSFNREETPQTTSCKKEGTSVEALEQVKKMFNQHNIQQKKLEQNFYSRIHLLENNHIEIVSRINRLNSSISMMDIKSHNQGNEELKNNINYLQKKNSNEIQSIKTMFQQKWVTLQENICNISSMVEKQLKNLHLQNLETREELSTKIQEEKFKQFQTNIVSRIQKLKLELFGNCSIEKETKKALYLFEKKLQKLQIIERILKQRQEDQKQITLTPSNFSVMKKQFSIHSSKKFSKSEQKQKGDNLLTKKFLSKRKINYSSMICEDME